MSGLRSGSGALAGALAMALVSLPGCGGGGGGADTAETSAPAGTKAVAAPAKATDGPPAASATGSGSGHEVPHLPEPSAEDLVVPPPPGANFEQRWSYPPMEELSGRRSSYKAGVKYEGRPLGTAAYSTAMSVDEVHAHYVAAIRRLYEGRMGMDRLREPEEGPLAQDPKEMEAQLAQMKELAPEAYARAVQSLPLVKALWERFQGKTQTSASYQADTEAGGQRYRSVSIDVESPHVFGADADHLEVHEGTVISYRMYLMEKQ